MVGLLESCLIFLILSFLICKMEAHLAGLGGLNTITHTKHSADCVGHIWANVLGTFIVKIPEMRAIIILLPDPGA